MLFNNYRARYIVEDLKTTEFYARRTVKVWLRYCRAIEKIEAIPFYYLSKKARALLKECRIQERNYSYAKNAWLNGSCHLLDQIAIHKSITMKEYP